MKSLAIEPLEIDLLVYPHSTSEAEMEAVSQHIFKLKTQKIEQSSHLPKPKIAKVMELQHQILELVQTTHDPIVLEKMLTELEAILKKKRLVKISKPAQKKASRRMAA